VTDSTPLDHEELLRRLSRDLIDGYDEELELEIEDRDLPKGSRIPSDDEKTERHRYFQELFRLQSELVKLQDWVVATRQKVVLNINDNQRPHLDK